MTLRQWQRVVSEKVLVLAEVLAMGWELEWTLKRAIMEMRLEQALLKFVRMWELETVLEPGPGPGFLHRRHSEKARFRVP